MRKQIKSVIACVIAVAASAMLPMAASVVRAVVTEAGAHTTGKTDSTLAIQKCIDRVSAVPFKMPMYRIPSNKQK